MTVSTQKRIRDLQRLLQKKGDSMTAEDKASLQLKIDELQGTKQENLQKVVKKKHESKYHMVKFFERKKCTRHYQYVVKGLAKLQAELDGSEDKKEKKRIAKELKELEAQKTLLEDDLCYIMYYPVEMKYVALYAGVGEDGEADDEEKETKTLRRSLLEGKVLEQSTKARESARELRQRDVAATKEDLVQHAIEVQLKGKQAAGEQQEKKKRKLDRDDAAENHSDAEEVAPTPKAQKAAKNKAVDSTEEAAPLAKKQKKDTAASSLAPMEAAVSKDSFFVEEASAEDLAAPAHKQSAAFTDGDLAQVKQAVNHKKYVTHKKLHGGKPHSNSNNYHNNSHHKHHNQGRSQSPGFRNFRKS